MTVRHDNKIIIKDDLNVLGNWVSVLFTSSSSIHREKMWRKIEKLFFRYLNLFINI